MLITSQFDFYIGISLFYSGRIGIFLRWGAR